MASVSKFVSLALLALLLVAALLVVSPARATHLPAVIVFESSSGSSVNNPGCAGSASLTFSHTVPNGENRILLVSVAFSQVFTINSITYAGSAMTLTRSDTNLISMVETVSTYYLLEPSVGTANVIVTLSGASTILLAISVSFSNVLQSGPIGDTNGASYTNVLSAHTDLDISSTSLVSEMPWGVAVGIDNSGGVTATVQPDSGQNNDIFLTRDLCVADTEFRDGIFSITTGSGPRAGNWDLDTNPAWPFPSNSGTVQMINLVPSRASDGGGDGLPPPGFFPFVPSKLPAPPYCTSALTVVLSDTRPEAANGVLWIWDWGDKAQNTSASPSAVHTYPKEDVYQVSIRVQDKSGRIDTFYGHLNLVGPGCAILTAAYLIGPYLLATLIIVAFTLFIHLIARRKSTKRSKMVNRVLAVTLVVLAVVIAVFVYYGWPLELPGHIKFA